MPPALVRIMGPNGLAQLSGMYPAAVAEPGQYEIMGHDLRDDDLRAGDVIPFGLHAWTIVEVLPVAGTSPVETVILYREHRSDGGVSLVHRFTANKDRRWGEVARPIAAVAAAPKQDPSMWNGTCPKCGRGTYTGGWKLEHEGGSCP